MHRDEEKQPFSRASLDNNAEADRPLYYDSNDTPRAKAAQIIFGIVVSLAVAINFILSIVQTVNSSFKTGLYLMMGFSLLGFAVIEIILIVFLRHGDISPGKIWFVYTVGACIILESIFLDILLFH